MEGLKKWIALLATITILLLSLMSGLISAAPGGEVEPATEEQSAQVAVESGEVVLGGGASADMPDQEGAVGEEAPGGEAVPLGEATSPAEPEGKVEDGGESLPAGEESQPSGPVTLTGPDEPLPPEAEVPETPETPAASILASVTPELFPNWQSGDAKDECQQAGCSATYAYKVDNAANNGTYLPGDGNTITIYGSDGYTFNWSSAWPVSCVIVKGGQPANVFYYGSSYGDTGLYAPLNTNTPAPDDTYEISHVTFCYNAPPQQNPGSICGMKWKDKDCSGGLSWGDWPMGGVTIQLYDGEGALVKTTTTNILGIYSFCDLQPGRYTVKEVAPSGYYPSFPPDGEWVIDLASGEHRKCVNFFNAPAGVIKGFKFLDKDCDGKWDRGEPGLEGVTIKLTKKDSGETWETVTGKDGSFRFDGLKPGKYEVEEVVPEGHYPTTKNPVCVKLCCGETEVVCFGNARYGSISGTKYLGCEGEYEPLAGLTIELWKKCGQSWVYQTETVTGADGSYRFDNLKPGKYLVKEVPDAEQEKKWYFVDPLDGKRKVILCCGEDEEGVDFYNAPYGSVCGYKFLDLDGDGKWDDGEPGIPGVTVKLTHALEDGNGETVTKLLNSLELTAETDEEGYFCFDQLLPGTYQVEVDETTVPEGHYASTPNPVKVELACGEKEEVLFGNAPFVDISGSKWEDLDCDGVHDAGEPGVPGVKIALLDSEGNEIDDTTTGADGSYAFTDLKPGVYGVKEALSDAQLELWFTVSPQGGVHKEIKLLEGKDAEGIDFFNCRYGKISGTKWLDADGDRLLNKSADKPLAGITVLLTGKTLLGTEVNKTAVTDASGNYSFDKLLPGAYTVEEKYDTTALEAVGDVSKNVTVVSGGDVEGIDFFNAPVASVGGEVVTPPAQPEIQPEVKGEVTLPVTGMNQLPLILAAGWLMLLGLISLMLGMLHLRRN